MHGVSHPAFTPQLQSITTPGLVLIFHPTEVWRLSQTGWHSYIRKWSAVPILTWLDLE